MTHSPLFLTTLYAEIPVEINTDLRNYPRKESPNAEISLDVKIFRKI